MATTPFSLIIIRIIFHLSSIKSATVPELSRVQRLLYFCFGNVYHPAIIPNLTNPALFQLAKPLQVTSVVSVLSGWGWFSVDGHNVHGFSFLLNRFRNSSPRRYIPKARLLTFFSSAGFRMFPLNSGWKGRAVVVLRLCRLRPRTAAPSIHAI